MTVGANSVLDFTINGNVLILSPIVNIIQIIEFSTQKSIKLLLLGGGGVPTDINVH